MEDWEKELKDEFGRPAPPPNRDTTDGDPDPKPIPIDQPDLDMPPEELREGSVGEEQDMGMFTKIFVIVLLLAILGGTLYWAIKKKNQTAVAKPKPAPTLPVQPDPPVVPDLSNSRIDKLEAEVKELKVSMAKMATEMDKNWKKIQVLGIVTNENAMIQKYKYDPRNTIYITRHWGLSGNPRYLKLSKEDIDFINSLQVSLASESVPEAASPGAQPPEVKPETPAPIPPPIPEPDAADAQEMLKLRKDVDILAENNYHLYRKVRVLGILTNENAHVVKKYLPQAQLVTITRDWGLSQTPQYLQLTDEDKDFLDGQK